MRAWRGWIAAALLIALALTGGPDALDMTPPATQAAALGTTGTNEYTAAENTGANAAATNATATNGTARTTANGTVTANGTARTTANGTARTTAVETADTAWTAGATADEIGGIAAYETAGTPRIIGVTADRTAGDNALSAPRAGSAPGETGVQARDDAPQRVGDGHVYRHLRLAALPPSPQTAAPAPVKGLARSTPVAASTTVTDAGGPPRLGACSPEALQTFRC